MNDPVTITNHLGFPHHLITNPSTGLFHVHEVRSQVDGVNMYEHASEDRETPELNEAEVVAAVAITGDNATISMNRGVTQFGNYQSLLDAITHIIRPE